MPRSVTIWSGAAILAACASVASAAPPEGPGAPPLPPGGEGLHMLRREAPTPEARAARLKAILQLSPAQDGAVDAFIVATAPPNLEDLPAPDRMKVEAMTTPERLDRMADLHKRAAARMAKVEDATRAFYSSLTPSQKKAFDALPPPAVMGFAGPPGGGAMMGRPGRP